LFKRVAGQARAHFACRQLSIPAAFGAGRESAAQDHGKVVSAVDPSTAGSVRFAGDELIG
jgi:hypothetical protein